MYRKNIVCIKLDVMPQHDCETEKKYEKLCRNKRQKYSEELSSVI